MTENSFPYFLRIESFRRFSIIRFPNDTHIFNVLVTHSQKISREEFYSLTCTSREISVIQDAKYPTYPQELGDHTVDVVQVEEGFVLIEVVPAVGGPINFGTTPFKSMIDCSGDWIIGTVSRYFGREENCFICD